MSTQVIEINDLKIHRKTEVSTRVIEITDFCIAILIEVSARYNTNFRAAIISMEASARDFTDFREGTRDSSPMY